MSFKRYFTLFLFSSFFLFATTAQAAIPAFPGAEGFGAQSVGGRGGRVIEVTHLNDSGSGSLRACVESSGPRICVFRTGGTIELSSGLTIRNPYITIAGQTAPGGGITLKNGSATSNTITIRTHEVVIRYLRIRPGPGGQPDGLAIYSGGYNVVIDHCSISWGVDENMSAYTSPYDLTIQWSIFAEGLYCSTHPQGCHSMGPLFGSDGSGDMSFHHNLMVHNYDRSPRIKTAGIFDNVNNVAYNSGKSTVSNDFARARVNYVGNYFKTGPSRSFDNYLNLSSQSGNGFAIFVEDNWRDHHGSLNKLTLSSGTVSSSHDAPVVKTTSATVAYNQVLANAGANIALDCDGTTYSRRDIVDLRIINDVKNRSGRIIDDPSEVGGWPKLDRGTPCADSDHDGMPNEWENNYGFNTNNASDGPQDADGDGYTNLEEYLNSTNPRGDGQIPTNTSTPYKSPTPSATPTPSGSGLEAEDATLSTVNFETQWPGYSGRGYIDYEALSGAYVRWENVNVVSSGTHTINFVYALGKADRSVEVKVNGSVVDSSLNFPQTGPNDESGWGNWTTLKLTATLKSGTNTVQVTTNGYEGPNLDYLYIEQGAAPTSTSGPPFSGDANEDGKIDVKDYAIWVVNYFKYTGNSFRNGDFNNDGFVDGLDYVIWLNNYSM